MSLRSDMLQGNTVDSQLLAAAMRSFNALGLMLGTTHSGHIQTDQLALPSAFPKAENMLSAERPSKIILSWEMKTSIPRLKVWLTERGVCRRQHISKSKMELNWEFKFHQ